LAALFLTPSRPDPSTKELRDQILVKTHVTAQCAQETTDRVLVLEVLSKKILGMVTQSYRQPDPQRSGGYLPNAQQFPAAPSAGSMMSNMPGSFPLASSKRENRLAVAEERESDFPNQAPQDHETGAHHLMDWPWIKPFFDRAGGFSKEYPQEADVKNGTLRPYGLSYVSDHETVGTGDMQATSPSYSDTSRNEHVSVSSPEDGLCLADFMRNDKQQRENIGGLNANGSLKLDKNTVLRLYESYLRHMWLMHPFLDVRGLNNSIQDFINKHSGGSGGKSPNFAVPEVNGRGGAVLHGASSVKRKRSSGPGAHFSDSNTPNAGHSAQPQSTKLERSMTNALILLVLALGKVLESDKFILHEDEDIKHPTPEHSYQGSPPGVVRSLLPYTSERLHNAPSLEFASRDSSMERVREETFRNVDKYPGLAYFACASDILGNNFGGNEIIHAQSFLLAGLYLGQFGRVVESWSWIDAGCRAITILQEK
jgi:hypothetical protein